MRIRKKSAAENSQPAEDGSCAVFRVGGFGGGGAEMLAVGPVEGGVVLEAAGAGGFGDPHAIAEAARKTGVARI